MHNLTGDPKALLAVTVTLVGRSEAQLDLRPTASTVSHCSGVQFPPVEHVPSFFCSVTQISVLNKEHVVTSSCALSRPCGGGHHLTHVNLSGQKDHHGPLLASSPCLCPQLPAVVKADLLLG